MPAGIRAGRRPSQDDVGRVVGEGKTNTSVMSAAGARDEVDVSWWSEPRTGGRCRGRPCRTSASDGKEPLPSIAPELMVLLRGADVQADRARCAVETQTLVRRIAVGRTVVRDGVGVDAPDATARRRQGGRGRRVARIRTRTPRQRGHQHAAHREIAHRRTPAEHLRRLVERDRDGQHRDRGDPHAHERGQPVGAERDQTVHEQRVQRVGADHPGAEHRADDQRADEPGVRAERGGVRDDLARRLEPEPEQQADRDREQRARAFAQPSRQQARLRAGDARTRRCAAGARSARRPRAARRSRSRCRSFRSASPCAVKRVPSTPTSAEIASTITVWPPAKNVPTKRLSSGVFGYALRVTLSIAAR